MTEKDTIFTKQFKANMPLAFTNGEVDYKMNWYIGPTDYATLKSYDRDFHKIISLGWGIFGWINMFIFIPLFGFLSSLHSLWNCDYCLYNYNQNCDVANNL
jgi:YidC/Oxa1 family membrane protein insertase